MKTTLNLIRSKRPSKKFWYKLLKNLGKVKSDDVPLDIKTILEYSGYDDALWCLQAVPNIDKELRLFAVWCARTIQVSFKDVPGYDSEKASSIDDALIKALDIASKVANGDAEIGELRCAWENATQAEYSASIPYGAGMPNYAHAYWHAVDCACLDDAWKAAYYADSQLPEGKYWIEKEDELIRMCDKK